eukprot:6469433-Amphidinium_carterae.4
MQRPSTTAVRRSRPARSSIEVVTFQHFAVFMTVIVVHLWGYFGVIHVSRLSMLLDSHKLAIYHHVLGECWYINCRLERTQSRGGSALVHVT